MKFATRISVVVIVDICIKIMEGKKKLLHPFGPLLSDVWTDIHRIKHNKYRDDHPCQLPVHLLERIILMSTDEGDIVFDPFLGTGTTALAAKRLGRNYIGVELDKEYVRISENKLAMEKSDSKIDDVWVGFFLDKIITIRDIDWEKIAPSFIIPEMITDIDHKEIMSKNGKINKGYEPQKIDFQDLPLFANAILLEKK